MSSRTIRTRSRPVTTKSNHANDPIAMAIHGANHQDTFVLDHSAEGHCARWRFLPDQPFGASDPIQHRGKAPRSLRYWIPRQETECQAPMPCTLDEIVPSPHPRLSPTSEGDQQSWHHHLDDRGSDRTRSMIQPIGWLGVSSQFFWPFDQIVVPEVSGRVPKTSTDVEPTSAEPEQRLAGSNPRPQSRSAVQVDGPSGGFGGPPHQSSGRKNVLPPEALPPCFRPEARAPQKQPSVASMIGGCETKRS